MDEEGGSACFNSRAGKRGKQARSLLPPEKGVCAFPVAYLLSVASAVRATPGWMG